MSRFSLHNGLIYKTFDSKPTDKIYLMLKSDGSKFTFLAKGIKKSNSKNIMAIDIGNFVNIKTVDNYNIPILTDSLLENENTHFRTNYLHFLQLNFVFELIDKFAQEDLILPSLFKNTKKILEFIKINFFEKTIGIYMLKILHNTGNLPDLSKCTLTQKDLQSENIYAGEEIGFFSKSDNFEDKIDPNVYRIIRFGLSFELEKMLNLKTTPFQNQCIENLALEWTSKYLGYELKSIKLLQKYVRQK